MANHIFGKKQLAFRLRRNGDANLKEPGSDCLPLHIYFDPRSFSLDRCRDFYCYKNGLAHGQGRVRVR